MQETFLGDNGLILACLVLSVFRIFLEVFKFNFSKLPLTQRLGSQTGDKVHKVGLYLSVGYIILFSPSFLFG
jgi:hypothetical protein